ncbi:MAG: glycosyltransferase family 2 protein [Nevskia sp.]|nr:glycosyltransferase family 2 protein [Nevskia sp.]
MNDTDTTGTPAIAAGADAHAAGAAELSVVVPTFNERGNVAELVRRLAAALAGIAWEVIFVDDDSPDGTADAVRELACADTRVRCVQRIGRRGLSSACVEGILASSAQYVAVMDADLQHDERTLPAMLATLRQGGVDIVVGSRYVEGGEADWAGARATMSRLATRLSHIVAPAALKDPMSGYFMLPRTVFMQAVRNTSAIGFKILLDLFASSPRPLVFREIPYRFRNRAAGESKLDSTALWDYLLLLLDKLVGRYVPVRFLSFSIIGAAGVLIHMAVLTAALHGLGLPFDWSQGAATLVAMTANFLLNNLLTYRDRRLKGLRALRGLLWFYAACGIGAAANVGVAGAIFEHHYRWWVAGVAGIAISAVWNYAATANFVWKRK